MRTENPEHKVRFSPSDVVAVPAMVILSAGAFYGVCIAGDAVVGEPPETKPESEVVAEVDAALELSLEGMSQPERYRALFQNGVRIESVEKSEGGTGLLGLLPTETIYRAGSTCLNGTEYTIDYELKFVESDSVMIAPGFFTERTTEKAVQVEGLADYRILDDGTFLVQPRNGDQEIAFNTDGNNLVPANSSTEEVLGSNNCT